MTVISFQEATKIFAEHMTQLISELLYSAAPAKVELTTLLTRTQYSMKMEISSLMKPLSILTLLSSLLTTLMTSLLRLTMIVTRITSRLSIPRLMVSSTSRLMLTKLNAQLPLTVSSKPQQLFQAYRLPFQYNLSVMTHSSKLTRTTSPSMSTNSLRMISLHLKMV